MSSRCALHEVNRRALLALSLGQSHSIFQHCCQRISQHFTALLSKCIVRDVGGGTKTQLLITLGSIIIPALSADQLLFKRNNGAGSEKKIWSLIFNHREQAAVCRGRGWSGCHWQASGSDVGMLCEGECRMMLVWAVFVFCALVDMAVTCFVCGVSVEMMGGN